MAEAKKIDGSLALQKKQYRVITIEATEKPQDIKLRVAAYARVSSSSADQLNSYAAQNNYYRDLITGKDNWRLVDIYADQGITGTSTEKRGDFQRLLADCRRGLIDRVLVKSISRFARNTTECLETIRELKLLGISVFFEKENIDTATMTGEMMTALFASLAQGESKSISDNMRQSYQWRMKNGTYIPPMLPFGYALVEKTIKIVPEQAVVVRRIFTEYLSGQSVERIAAGLKADQIPCKSGRVAWDATAIRYILSNEKYTGDSVWQKYYTTDTLPYKCKTNRGERESYFASGTHDAIISKETFEKANAIKRMRAKKITLTQNEPYTFRQRMHCNKCGSLFRRKTVRGIPYWACIGHEKERHGLTCSQPEIAEDKIEQAFLRLYYKLKHYNELILNQMLSQLLDIRTRYMLWSADIVELNKQISDLSSQNQVLTELKRQGLVDPDIFISQSNELAEQLRTAKLQKERLLNVEGDHVIAQTQELIETIEAGPDFLDSFDAELFGDLVDRIIADSNEQIRFRLKNGLELTETIERTVR